MRSWKVRYVEIRGGLFLYWRNQGESIYSPSAPKGAAVITGVAEWSQVSNIYRAGEMHLGKRGGGCILESHV